MTTQAATSTIQAPADGDFYKYGLKPVIGNGIMDATLKRLGTVEIKAMERSNFVKPQSVMYELDGKSHAFCMVLHPNHMLMHAAYMLIHASCMLPSASHMLLHVGHML